MAESGTGTGRFLHEVPAWLMCSFCRLMDALGRADWERFASRVVRDQVELRLAGTSEGRTQRVLWSWGHRNARVGDLLALLRELELDWAHDLIASWQPPPEPWPHLPPSTSLAPPLPSVPLPSAPPAPCSTARTLPWDLPKALSVPVPPLPEPSCLSLPLPGPPPSSLFSTSSHDTMTSPDPVTLLSQVLPPPGSPRLLAWPLAELVEATGGFSEQHKVGEGGFGCVYRARLRHTDCAVKRLKEDAELNWSLVHNSFITELEKLSRYRHPNIVELAGFCAERGHFCLVYVFMPNGSLDDRLRPQDGRPPLTWPQRLSVLVGAARAVQFLHQDVPSLIHGDVKSSNILLDQALTPRLSDFGLARVGAGGGRGGRSGTLGRTGTVRGTLAYLPPEYVQTGALSPAIDTYSFGVVLLEALTGRRALETDERGQTKFLKDLVAAEEEEAGVGDRNVGTRLGQAYADSQAGSCPSLLSTSLGHLAARCLHRRSKQRPCMDQVYEELERLQQALSWEPALPPCRSPVDPQNQPEESDDSLPGVGGSFSSPLPPPAVVINPARRRIMERLELYDHGLLDSLGVLDSGPPSGSGPSRLPEESDDFDVDS